jgi:hypothetical protein
MIGRLSSHQIIYKALKMTNGLENNESQAQAAPGYRERPLDNRALTSQKCAQHHHPALPTVLLIKWKEIRGRQQKIHRAEGSACRKRSGNQIDDDPCQQNQNLLTKRTSLKFRHVQSDICSYGKRMQFVFNAAEAKAEELSSPPEAELRSTHATGARRRQMP